MVSTFAIIGATVLGVARAFFNRSNRRAIPTPAADPLLQERLDRLESAIQAIAIETERIAEGQRFTTKLLSQPGISTGVAGVRGAPIVAPSIPSPTLPAPGSSERHAAL